MTCRKRLFAFLLCFCSLYHAEAAELESRTYRVPWHLPGERIGAPAEKLIEDRGEKLPPSRVEEEWRKFFSKFGVAWPEGARVRGRSVMNEIMVVNTAENHRLIDQILRLARNESPEVEIEFLLIEFVKKDIVGILGFKPGRMVESADILRLWKAGKGKVVSAPRVTTQSGAEATVKSVTECVFPTEFMPGTPTNAPGPTSGAAWPIPERDGLDVREVGHVLTVLPEVDLQSDRVCLTLAPEVVGTPSWTDYGDSYITEDGRQKHVSMEQPQFPTREISTTVTVANGKPMVVGGGIADREGEHLAYMLATAWIRDRRERPEPVTVKLGAMALRGFDVPPSVNAVAHERFYVLEEMKDASYEDLWKHLLSAMGVTWPEGSVAEPVHSTQRLIVKNTPENIERVAKAFASLEQPVSAWLVDIELQYVSCAAEDVESVLREQGSRTIDVDLVCRLGREGKCDLIAAPKTVTESGAEVTIKGVTQYIYPTRFVEQTMGTNTGARAGTRITMPADFETREVGAYVTFLPEVCAREDDVAIVLTMAPDFCRGPHWREADADARQPWFETFSISSTVSLKNGETALVGACEGETPGRRLFLLATTRIVDVE